MELGITVIQGAIDGFIETEKTTRVSSVFVFSSETRLLPHEQTAQLFRVKEFQNKYCASRPANHTPLR